MGYGLIFSILCSRWCGVAAPSLILDAFALMNQLSLNFSGKRRKVLDKEINYFIKGDKEGRLNYHKVSYLKLPIGSGAVESLIRQAVNLRMKGNSKFWLKENAEIILHARCQ